MKKLYLLMLYNYPYGVYDHNNIDNVDDGDFDECERENSEFIECKINEKLS